MFNPIAFVVLSGLPSFDRSSSIVFSFVSCVFGTSAFHSLILKCSLFHFCDKQTSGSECHRDGGMRSKTRFMSVRTLSTIVASSLTKLRDEGEANQGRATHDRTVSAVFVSPKRQKSCRLMEKNLFHMLEQAVSRTKTTNSDTNAN